MGKIAETGFVTREIRETMENAVDTKLIHIHYGIYPSLLSLNTSFRLQDVIYTYLFHVMDMDNTMVKTILSWNPEFVFKAVALAWNRVTNSGIKDFLLPNGKQDKCLTDTIQITVSKEMQIMNIGTPLSREVDAGVVQSLSTVVTAHCRFYLVEMLFQITRNCKNYISCFDDICTKAEDTSTEEWKENYLVLPEECWNEEYKFSIYGKFGSFLENAEHITSNFSDVDPHLFSHDDIEKDLETLAIYGIENIIPLGIEGLMTDCVQSQEVELAMKKLEVILTMFAKVHGVVNTYHKSSTDELNLCDVINNANFKQMACFQTLMDSHESQLFFDAIVMYQFEAIMKEGPTFEFDFGWSKLGPILEKKSVGNSLSFSSIVCSVLYVVYDIRNRCCLHLLSGISKTNYNFWPEPHVARFLFYHRGSPTRKKTPCAIVHCFRKYSNCILGYQRCTRKLIFCRQCKKN